MISCVIIDDEEFSLKILKNTLAKFNNITILASFTDPIVALSKIPNLVYDVLFVDVEMPVMNGFELARECVMINSDLIVVFVTAYEEFALKAFEIDALDYVLKPVVERRLAVTISRIEKMMLQQKKSNISDDQLKKLSEIKSNKISKIIAREGEKIFLLNPENVLYFTILNGSVLVVTETKTYDTRNTINYWEDELKHLDFFRCHKSFLININKIEVVYPMFNNSYELKLYNHKTAIPISRRSACELRQMFHF